MHNGVHIARKQIEDEYKNGLLGYSPQTKIELKTKLYVNEKKKKKKNKYSQHQNTIQKLISSCTNTLRQHIKNSLTLRQTQFIRDIIFRNITPNGKKPMCVPHVSEKIHLFFLHVQ